MQDPLKSWDNVYTITYQVDSYLPFQWEVCPLVGSMTDPSTLRNDKVARPASGENFMIDVIQPSARLCTGNYNWVEKNARGIDLNGNSTQNMV